MVRDVIKLHGVLTQIISDRDPIFLSDLWRELFKLQGTMLAHNSAYHLQTDGQTEMLNRYLEDYLRCFFAYNPRRWPEFLPWAEWFYNTSWHSTIHMTPFEVVFGRAPPTLSDYIAGTTGVATMDELLTYRVGILTTLQKNLRWAQNRMHNQENSSRIDIEFKLGDWVLLRLQPYRQSSVAWRSSHKLARRFYGPFQIVERIGEVAYCLKLSDTVRIHNVFHVAKLKKFLGDPSVTHTPLPNEFMNQQPILSPLAILKSQQVLKRGRSIAEVLIQWKW